MPDIAYFIRRCGDDCSIVVLRPDGREEILDQGLILAEAETLYFICIGEPVHEASSTIELEHQRPKRRRARQLAFKL